MAVDADGHSRRHRQPLGRRCRLRARHSAGRRHLLCRRPASACRYRSGVRRRLRWLLGQLRAGRPGPAAAGPDAGWRAAPESRHGDQYAQQLFLHDGVISADHRPRLVADGACRRTAHQGHTDRRRRGRSPRSSRPDGCRAQGAALVAYRRRPGSRFLDRYADTGKFVLA